MGMDYVWVNLMAEMWDLQYFTRTFIVDAEVVDLAEPEFEGLWDRFKPYKAPKDIHANGQCKNTSIMETVFVKLIVEFLQGKDTFRKVEWNFRIGEIAETGLFTTVPTMCVTRLLILLKLICVALNCFAKWLIPQVTLFFFFVMVSDKFAFQSNGSCHFRKKLKPLMFALKLFTFLPFIWDSFSFLKLQNHII